MTFDIRKYITENNDARRQAPINEFAAKDMGKIESASEKLRRAAAQVLSALVHLTKEGKPLKNNRFDSLAHNMTNSAINMRQGAEHMETIINHEHEQRTRK